MIVVCMLKLSVFESKVDGRELHGNQKVFKSRHIQGLKRTEKRKEIYNKY